MPRRHALSVSLVLPSAALATVLACDVLGIDRYPRDTSTPPGPQAQCESACVERAHGCTEKECAKGCAFVLDRLVEHEGETVLGCIASRAKTEPKNASVGAGGDRKAAVCGDAVWAECAVRVGVHADGGPPAPTKSEDEGP
jgi:hypothetical protein